MLIRWELAAFPDAQVSLIILPMFPFSIKAGVASAVRCGCISSQGKRLMTHTQVAFDVLGLLSARVR